MSMGFNEFVLQLIAALDDGRFQHEDRYDPAKNLLAARVVSPEDVVTLLRACRHHQHETSEHHKFKGVEVHILTPRVAGVSWYIKAYFVDDDDDEPFFISVHQ